MTATPAGISFCCGLLQAHLTYRPDLRPTAICLARSEDCCRDCIINLIAPVGETSNRAEGPGVDNLQVAW